MAAHPSTSWTHQFDQLGEAGKVLYLNNDWTVPTPAAREVLVDVKAAAVNPSDLYFVSGQYAFKPHSFPAQAGTEGAGVVVAVGEGVDNSLVGKRVHFLSKYYNAWASYALAKAETVVPLLDSVPFEVGAQLTVNPLTVLGLIDELGVAPGDYLIQDAAASALGRLLIQIAKIKGFKTINVVRRDSQKEELTAIGADHVINSETEDVVAKVHEITGGGAKHAIDAVGGELGGKLLQSLGRGGKLLVYGILSGQPVPASPGPLIFQRATIGGFWLVNWLQDAPAKAVEAYKEIQELYAQGKIALPSRSFDGKTQLHEAIQHSVTPGKNEKTVLVNQ